MSVEEEVELKDLVAQTLETNGCLARIRAQLRASIFLALDEDVKLSQQQPLLNNKIKTYLETEEGRTMFCVVREFLEFFNLYFTISVFEPESYSSTGYQYEGKQKVAKDLGLDALEDTTVPLLLQLIRIAQAKTKSLEIDLNFNSTENNENKSLTQEIYTTSNVKKTDSDNLSSNTATNGNEQLSDDKSLVENISLQGKLNVTFDLNSPTVSLKVSENDKRKLDNDFNEPKRTLDNNCSKKESKEDDTYEDTSSIAEDNVAQISLDNTKVPEVLVNGIEDCILIEAPTSDVDVSQPVVKESKTPDKLKSPQKSEKGKPKTSLSSLSDLPPLQMNKRVNDILPSLYSKEFKDKSNLRELDKLFDMEAEYEEDFMCSGDDLSVKSDYLKSDNSKINLLDDLQMNKAPSLEKSAATNKRDLKQNKSSSRIISECNKAIFKPLVTSPRGKDVKVNENGSENGSNNSSVSEHLEIASSD